MNQQNIREHMPVVCSMNQQLGTVDHVEGNQIKLAKDESGQHHYIPTSMVDHVDTTVHLNQPANQVKQQWTTSPSQGAMR